MAAPAACPGSRELPGGRTILADMADWNPAEMLGSRPAPLDRSLYRFLITRSTWNAARVSLGYVDVGRPELMMTVAGKPYIDTQVSFTSLTPATVPPPLRATLIPRCLALLGRRPALQDKVEFEIVFTCFDLVFERRAADLASDGMPADDMACLRQALLAHTNRLLAALPALIDADQRRLRALDLRSRALTRAPRTFDDALAQAFALLRECRARGTFAFARLARLAFVSLALVRSLIAAGIVSPDEADRFMGTIAGIPSRMAADVAAAQRGQISPHVLVERYGHLRAGTYSILSPRYDQIPGLFDGAPRAPHMPREASAPPDAELDARIAAGLAAHGVRGPAAGLLPAARQALEEREYAKFAFTRPLSAAIELLALAGEHLGLAREELALLDLETIARVARISGRDRERARGMLREHIAASAARQRQAALALPPVLASPHDLVAVSVYESRPNFITRQHVEAPLHHLEQGYGEQLPPLENRIVLIEHADPGYDWIFRHRPRGLITKDGGVASHMAIRCAELGLPAAIGCGQAIYERLTRAHRVDLDCANERVTPLH